MILPSFKEIINQWMLLLLILFFIIIIISLNVIFILIVQTQFIVGLF